jgi:hypothetical protein
MRPSLGRFPLVSSPYKVCRKIGIILKAANTETNADPGVTKH